MSQIFRIFLLVAAMVSVSLPADAQRTYKWVDTEGKVHYGDKVPPEYKDQAHQRLNESGVVVEDVPRALTEAEILAELSEARAAAAEAERARAQQMNDNYLLLTYASESDIIGVRDQRLDVIARAIEASRAYIRGRTRGLSNLMDRAAQMESRGHAVSDALSSSIEEIRRQIGEQESFIDQQADSRGAIEDKYNAELVRYREVIERRKNNLPAGE